ncbi:MAG: HTH-type transcriptional regulator NorG [Paracidovorax wautersii]|uniref:HTH-type transcriptional regulator NorG n=1 Tax=Paracidovorax wautersii TaxID=1177982 RepID=A0A7V8FM95_9BURK|nr:MAG: HTH-type transcriptional regulator NorG [Paracidovorax wautersii]
MARRLGELAIEAAPDQILLTDSGTQALDLLCRLLLTPGDVVLVDDPCYFNFHGLLRAHRVRAVGVRYTAQGPDLAQFEQADLTIAEDGIFDDFEPEPTARLAAFDGLARVVYVGSFSKTLSAATRCGFLAARRDWVEATADLKIATAFGSSRLGADLVYQMLKAGSYRRHVEGLRERLARTRGPVARRLEALGIRPWIEPRGGMFLWCELPDGVDAAELARAALAQGVVLAPGQVFGASPAAARFMRFNVAQCGDARLDAVLAGLLARP